MDAPSVIADSLKEIRELTDRVDAEMRDQLKTLARSLRDQRAKSYEMGRRAGYAEGLEQGRALGDAERETVYAAGFAEGVREMELRAGAAIKEEK